MIKKYDFFKTKYGSELLIDFIRLESLEKYLIRDPSHYLTYYDITVISSGKGIFCIDDYRYTIESRNVYFSSPGQLRKWDIAEAPKGYVIIFEEEFLCSFFSDTRFVQNLSYFNTGINPPMIVLTKEEYHQAVQLMEKVGQEIDLFNTNDKHILRALLYQILVYLNRIYITRYPSAEKSGDNRHIHKFVQLVNDEFHQSRSVNYYADKLSITSGHLNDIAKLYLGINAKQYIQQRVILEAKRLLRYSELSVSEIAWRLNYQDTSYFVRAFRKTTGFTPLTFRKKNP